MLAGPGSAGAAISAARWHSSTAKAVLRHSAGYPACPAARAARVPAALIASATPVLSSRTLISSWCSSHPIAIYAGVGHKPV